jgi:toxin CcdB
VARFDVYPTPIAADKGNVPFWLDVQADFLHGLGTRVVVPLRRRRSKEVLKDRLNPVFTVERIEVFADIANIAAFPARLLRRASGSLAGHALVIEDALDFLFRGY